ncbi:hypothetical protein FB45DRAFT_893682 [Roridomyces roridus]|uniref:Uncharacterized protein n=1 Tax=Roridomyces roridus TaxID=1738132 RepID=A0AAD7CHS0_9AGAR|nr:hypothetical protein FB45DRAFT_893682 [Roridomyces roridus]
MSLSFRLLRRILLGLVISVSATSVVLSVLLKPHLNHPEATYVLITILDTLISLSIFALTRKPLLDSPQKVATEVLGLFAMLPFSLILTLYVLGLSLPTYPQSTATALWIFAILQGFIFTGTILHTLYTMGLMAAAMLTVCVFDRDVWSRDIDSSPSPFPMGLLLSFICPCFSRPSDEEATPIEQVEARVCLPGCNCSGLKPHLTPDTSPRLETEPSMGMVRGVSSRSLVRVPNDVERRMSIAVSLSSV